MISLGRCATSLVLGIGYRHSSDSCNTNLALKGKGKFINRPTTTGGKHYDKYFVYIPTEVANDSQFPLRAGDVVEIKVDTKRKKLSIQKDES